MQAFNYAIDRAEVLRYLGYKGQAIDDDLDKRIDALSRKCLETANPKYCFSLFNIEKCDKGIWFKDTDVVFRGRDIHEHLSGAEICAVMAVTIGMSVERELLLLEHKSVSDALIYNAACTALVEAVADKCEEEIRNVATESGLRLNFRYSPGYGDFPLEQQREVLSLINADARLGITLTDSLLMLPRKSVSAVIGLFKDKDYVQNSINMCEKCGNFKNCDFRKRGIACGK